MQQPAIVWIVGLVCVTGNNFVYIFGFQYAPPEQVDLINFLWPIMVVVVAGFLPKEKFSMTSIISALLGFIGVYILLLSDEGTAAFQPQYLTGYIFGALSAITWTIYTLFSRTRKEVPCEMVGLFSGFGFLISLTNHLAFEETIIPTTTELMTLTFMGVTTYGTAFALWDYGVKKGNLKFLSTLSYGTPIASIGLLVIFGYSAPTGSLAISCLLVVIGSTLNLTLAGIKILYLRASSLVPQGLLDISLRARLTFSEEEVSTPKPYSLKQ